MLDLDGNASAAADYYTMPAIDNVDENSCWFAVVDPHRDEAGSQYFISQGGWGASYSVNMYMTGGNAFAGRLGSGSEAKVTVTLAGAPWLVLLGQDNNDIGNFTYVRAIQMGSTTVYQDLAGTFGTVHGTAPTDTYIGSRSDTSSTRAWNNAIGCVGHTSGYFPDGQDLVSVAQGRSPRDVFGDHLDMYCEMSDETTSTLRDVIGGRDLTRVGTPAPWPTYLSQPAGWPLNIAPDATGTPPDITGTPMHYYARRRAA